MFEDRFECDIDGTVMCEVIDNGDNRHVILNLWDDNGKALGIGLTPAKASELAEALYAVAAGV